MAVGDPGDERRGPGTVAAPLTPPAALARSGTGWPEPGGLLPREALKLVGLVAKEGLCGMEIVEVSPPYDHADITSLMALRIIVDTLGSMVAHGKMGAYKHIFDKEFKPF